MVKIIPDWALHNTEFWNTIRGRNLWFIKLRYAAVVMLVLLLFGAEYFLQIPLSPIQLRYIVLITSSILIYNILFHFLRRFLRYDPAKFNPVHLSFLQIIFDLIALMFLVYFTGGIESPLYMLAVFHMIIGSLILPGFIIYSIAYAVVLSFAFISFGQYYGLIPGQQLTGLLNSNLNDDINYIIAFNIVFMFVMFMSVVLANRLAKQLYRQEQILIESIHRLNTAEAEKQRYIIGVVHEIKTPITAVHSYLEIILNGTLGPVSDEIKERLNRSRIRSAEAIELTNNILRVSKLRLLDEAHFEEFSIDQVLKDIIEKQSVHIRQKHIHVNFRDDRVRKTKLKGDVFLMEIALSNLVNNAVKYTGREGRIDIILADNDDSLFITICDNGIGIPQDDISKIFNDFFKASNIRKLGFEGSGLGLSIVKQVIERHNGKIETSSPSKLAEEDRPGTCFRITLPIKA